ncbi:MAG: hypothetical protein J6J63_02470 [Oscillospiraceae bacterium]|nr:hypothetical protein [Oscillospiraceae bacterium]
MATQDSIYLLRECDAGAKMAMASLDDVKDRTRNTEMQKILLESRQQHELIAEEIHKLLDSIGTGEKDPSPMARGMSAVKTGVKMGLDDSDQTVADLITDGCGMGIKSLHRYLNQYAAAETIARAVCRMLIAVEEQLVCDIKRFL